MKRQTIFTAIFSVFVITSASLGCFDETDFFAFEALLNKPGVSYDLGLIKGADNVVVKDDSFVYQSHFDSRVAVVLRNIEMPESIDLKGLSVRLQIPTKEVISRYAVLQLDGLKVNEPDRDEIALLGYTMRIERNEDTATVLYAFEKSGVALFVSYDEEKPERGIEIRANFEGAETFSEKVVSELGQILALFGFAPEVLNALIEKVVVGSSELVEATDVDKDEFDFGSAIKLELDWLTSNGVIKGIEQQDIAEISSLAKAGIAGWNSRVVFESGWKPYYETGFPMLRDSKSCGGTPLTIDILPRESIRLNVTTVSAKDKLELTWAEIKKRGKSK